MKHIIFFLVITVSLISFVGCNNKTSNDEIINNEYVAEEEILTKSEVIKLAKEDDTVNYMIASVNSLKHYSISWGTCTANLNEDNSWTVQLKGNVSGYVDDYKTVYRGQEAFSVEVNVSSDGEVGFPRFY